MPEVEIRCPVGPRRLFTKLKLGEEFGRYTAENLIEFTCSDCRRRESRERGHAVRWVFHRYDFLGELVETAVQDEWQCDLGFSV